MDLTIYIADNQPIIEQHSLPLLLQKLPASLHPRALRYKSVNTAYNYVIGRLLLKRGLAFFGLDTDLEKIDFEESGKPFVAGLHFNISHSDHQVICACSQQGRLGVDLEKIMPIDFEDFSSMFSTKEWTVIKGAKDPIRSFYWFWTRKESIIKALGLNLSYLHQIELDVACDHFEVNGKRWFLKDLDVSLGYLGSVCSEQAIEQIELIEINLRD